MSLSLSRVCVGRDLDYYYCGTVRGTVGTRYELATVRSYGSSRYGRYLVGTDGHWFLMFCFGADLQYCTVRYVDTIHQWIPRYLRIVDLLPYSTTVEACARIRTLRYLLAS